MKVAVCDDEKIARSEILSLLTEYKKLKGIDIFPYVYENGGMLLDTKLDYDVIFMDYQMGEADGIEISRKIREVNKDCIIIFISAYPMAALDSFEVNTFRFLTKPIDRSKMFKALDDYMAAIDYDNLLILNTHEGVWKIKMSEIVYAEACKKHTSIYTTDKIYDVHIHLKKIEARLPKDRFIRCHRSFVVGFYHIKNHTNQEIVFENGRKAYIGKHYLTSFKTGFQSYVMRYNKGAIK